MEDIKFCKYCGQPLEKGANFCNKCGKSINSEQSTTTSQQKTYQQTNFVMDILRGFGKPNSAIRVISVISAIILALLQFFGMGYSVKIDAGWFSAKTKNMNAVKFLYEALFKVWTWYKVKYIHSYWLFGICNSIYRSVCHRSNVNKIYNIRLSCGDNY